jgi:hypothetical protein
VTARDACPRPLQLRAALEQGHRVRQRHALRLHDRINHATGRIAAEAVVQVLALGNDQAGSGILMEHAAHHPMLAALGQRVALALDQAHQGHFIF